MIEISNQKLIPDYAHRLNIFFSYQLGNNFLFMNKEMIRQLNWSLKYVISFYLGKRTTKNKRDDCIQCIKKFISNVIDFTKIIIDKGLIKSDLELCKEYVNLVIRDLNKNQNGNINSSGF